MEHSNYSPSRLKRIIECPGSVGLIDSLMITKTIKEDTPSSYAAKGTILHQVFERYYSGVTSGYEQLESDDQWLIRECVDYLEILIASLGHKNYYVKTESQVDLGQWGIPDVWGTLDYQIIDPIKRHVDIIDWKFGSGVTVYAKENPQLLAYAAGAIGWPSILQSITLHVVQPAIEHFDTWDLTINELYDWVHGTLAIAINKAASEIVEFNPGVEQCRWCEAKNHCETRINAAYDYAIKLFDAQTKLATVPKPEELVALIEQAPLVEKAIADIRLYMQTEMLRGVVFPGVKLVQGRANRRWIDEKKTITWLSEHTKIDEMFNSKIISPSQAEKLVKSLKKNEDYKKLFDQPPGKITLVHENDKRPAVNTTSGAVDVFQDYQAQVPDKLL